MERSRIPQQMKQKVQKNIQKKIVQKRHTMDRFTHLTTLKLSNQAWKLNWIELTANPWWERTHLTNLWHIALCYQIINTSKFKTAKCIWCLFFQFQSQSLEIEFARFFALVKKWIRLKQLWQSRLLEDFSKSIILTLNQSNISF